MTPAPTALVAKAPVKQDSPEVRQLLPPAFQKGSFQGSCIPIFQKPEDGCTAKPRGHTEMRLWPGQRSQELAATPAILPRYQVAHGSGLEHRGSPCLCPFTTWNEGDDQKWRKERRTGTSMSLRLLC